jgi:hypothetical protein
MFTATGGNFSKELRVSSNGSVNVQTKAKSIGQHYSRRGIGTPPLCNQNHDLSPVPKIAVA